MTNEKARPSLWVMEIERFAIHDGPGIRTLVFLQGCPLRCPWCANPESQRVGRQLMFSAERCCKCGACAAACPVGAICFAPESGPTFNRALCIGCGACGGACPAGAIHFSGVATPVADILDVVLRDKPYYAASGGGLTISGGEPFFQFEGFLALIKAAKAAGLSVAVETAGDILPQHLQTAEPFIDIFLFDVKHANADKLHEVAGAHSETVLENLRWLAHTALQKLTIRTPVVPGFNHSTQEIKAIFQLVAGLGPARVQLLPYHNLGTGKYARLGMAYGGPAGGMMKPKTLESYRDMGLSMGLDIQIGG